MQQPSAVFLCFLTAVIACVAKEVPPAVSAPRWDLGRIMQIAFPPEMFAAAFGDVGSLVTLLERWRNPQDGANVRDWVGQTPLHLAAKFGKLETAKLLIAKGALVDVKNGDFNETPIHLAAKSCYTDVVRLLIANHADVNVFANFRGETPIAYAIEYGGNSFDTVRALIEEGGAKVDAPNSHGRTPLHYAARQENLRLVRYLLDSGADVNVKDSGGVTPLVLLLKEGSLDPQLPLICFLIKRGAKVETEDEYLLSPLEHAVMRHMEPVVSLLLASGAQINRMSSNLTNFLTRIIRTKYLRRPRAVQLMFSHGLNTSNDTCNRPLFEIAKLATAQFIRDESVLMEIAWILQSHGEDRFHVDPCTGLSPAAVAALTQKFRLQSLFLQRSNTDGAIDTERFALNVSDALEHELAKFGWEKAAQVGIMLASTVRETAQKEDWQGQMGLHIAAFYGQTENAMMLALFGQNVNARGQSRRTPLHMAAGVGNEDLVEFLIDKGARLEAKDSKGQTPLLVAASQSNSVATVVKLIEKGANVHAFDLDGLSALHLAVERQYFEIMEVLLDAGIDPNYQNANGQTPLNYLMGSLCCYPQMPTVELLVRRGADVSLPDGYGQHPIHGAIGSGKGGAVILYLIEKGANASATDERGCRSPLPFYLSKTLNNSKVTDSEISATAVWLIRSGADLYERDRCGPGGTARELLLQTTRPLMKSLSRLFES